eukprot:7378829-Prymnesium_polylepis.1
MRRAAPTVPVKRAPLRAIPALVRRLNSCAACRACCSPPVGRSGPRQHLTALHPQCAPAPLRLVHFLHWMRSLMPLDPFYMVVFGLIIRTEIRSEGQRNTRTEARAFAAVVRASVIPCRRVCRGSRTRA